MKKRSQLVDKYKDIKELIKQIYNHHKGDTPYYFSNQTKGILTKRLHRNVSRLKKLIRIKKYKSQGEQGKIVPNILQRNFKAANPNEKWATDVTEFNVSGNKLYLSPIIDLFNGEIISYELSERPNFNQITNMLKKSLLNEYQIIPI
jgi:putative transposase